MQEIRIGNIYGATGGNFAGNVYDQKSAREWTDMSNTDNGEYP